MHGNRRSGAPHSRRSRETASSVDDDLVPNPRHLEKFFHIGVPHADTSMGGGAAALIFHQRAVERIAIADAQPVVPENPLEPSLENARRGNDEGFTGPNQLAGRQLLLSAVRGELYDRPSLHLQDAPPGLVPFQPGPDPARRLGRD